MPKLPVNLTTGKTALGAVAAFVGPQVVALLKDPARADDLNRLVANLGPAMKARTPEGRLAAKITALRAELDKVVGEGADGALRAEWLPRLDALETKRNLVVKALTGRQRARRLKAISAQADELLEEFLTLSDERISGRRPA